MNFPFFFLPGFSGTAGRFAFRSRLAGLLLVLLAGPAAAQLDVEARLQNPQGRWTVGDPVTVAVKLRYPQGVTAPSLVREFPEDTVLVEEKAGTPAKSGSIIQEKRTVRLAFFAAGAQSTGPLRYTMQWQGKLLEGTAPALPVTIQTVLPAGEKEPAPAPAEAPRVLPYPTAKLIGLIAVLLILPAAAAAAFWWWRRRRHQEEQKPAVPAHLLARDRLQSLAGKGYLERGVWRFLYFKASEIIKQYLGQELGIFVLERTTTEILHQLPGVEALSDGSRALVEHFLRSADAVKFAREVPDRSEAEAFLRNAFTIIHQVHEEWVRYRETRAAAAAGESA